MKPKVDVLKVDSIPSVTFIGQLLSLSFFRLIGTNVLGQNGNKRNAFAYSLWCKLEIHSFSILSLIFHLNLRFYLISNLGVPLASVFNMMVLQQHSCMNYSQNLIYIYEKFQGLVKRHQIESSFYQIHKSFLMSLHFSQAFFFLMNGNQIYQEDIQQWLYFKQLPNILWRPLQPYIANQPVILIDPRITGRCT